MPRLVRSTFCGCAVTAAAKAVETPSGRSVPEEKQLLRLWSAGLGLVLGGIYSRTASCGWIVS
jgi:hypothetical protein